jgi:hypothetical protein
MDGMAEEKGNWPAGVDGTGDRRAGGLEAQLRAELAALGRKEVPGKLRALLRQLREKARREEPEG